MIKPPPFDPAAPIVVLDIGNSTIGIGTWVSNKLKTPLSVDADDESAFAESFAAHTEALPKGRPAAVVASSVAPSTLSTVKSFVSSKLDYNTLVVGETLPLPMDVAVKDKKNIGVDRVCAAATAYERIKQSCIIVDFGTAVTVDLVDDDGTLLGGAILPGLDLQARVLHEHAEQLPLVEIKIPKTPFGIDTTEAIQTGVCRGLAGAVRALVEAYATSQGRWPQVVATGGDLELMTPECDFIDTAVSDLTLNGVGLAYTKYLTEAGV